MERKRKHGDPLHGGPLKLRRPKGTPCQIGRVDPWLALPACESVHYSLGFCNKHYERFSTHGDPTVSLIDREHGDHCSIDRCTKPFFSLGYCRDHYNRAWLHNGDPQGGKRWNDLAERLIRQTVVGPVPKRFYNHATDQFDGVPPCPCRDWTGAVRYKYGVISVGNKALQVHRIMYEQEVGPIPEGLGLDHLCSRPICCEPCHLDPVTSTENTRRRWLVINALHERYGDAYDEYLARRRNALVWPDDNRSDVS